MSTTSIAGSSNDKDNILDDIYKPPHQRIYDKNVSEQKQIQKQQEKQQETIHKLRIELIQAYSQVVDSSNEINELIVKILNLSRKKENSEKLKNEFDKKCSYICELKDKLSSYNVRNVNKKLKRKENKILKLSEALEKNSKENHERLNLVLNENDMLDKQIDELNQNLQKLKANKIKYIKLKSYYKNKAAELKEAESKHTNEVKQMQTEITELQKAIETLHDEQTEQGKERLEMFSKGRYKDEVRQVYMDILGMGIPMNKCADIIKTVLKNLVDTDVDRLPQKSLASILAVEAQVLAQAQAAEAILNSTTNCLHLDGTKKKFTEYSGFQVTNERGPFSLSHQIMPSGDADSYLKTTNKTFDELAESLAENEDDQKVISASLKSKINCIMTDRHVVNKSYLKLLEKEKLNAIGVLEINRDKTERERENEAHIHPLYCGLHILPNMPSAALKGLMNFEKEKGVSNPSGLIHPISISFFIALRKI